MTVLPVQTNVNVAMLPEDSTGYGFKILSYKGTMVTVSLTNLRESTEELLYMLAAYDENDQMISCVAVNDIWDSTETISLSVDCAGKNNAVKIKAFLLEPNSYVPISVAWQHKIW